MTSAMQELTAISPLDGRYKKKLLGLENFVSEMALIRIRIEIECRYLIALSEANVLRNFTQKEKAFLEQLSSKMSIQDIEKVKVIEQETNHDIKAVERALRNILQETSLHDSIEMIHFGLTSEDINNISHRLLLKRTVDSIYLPTLNKLISLLATMAGMYKKIPMLARTHGQPAVPTTLGKELVNFAIRLHRQRENMKKIQLYGKLTGAVGNFNAHVYALPAIDWITFSEKFVTSLALKPHLFTTQINPYDDLIEYFQAIYRINIIILALNQDMWRYISDDWFTQEIKRGEVGSSTMPQKVNPINFENGEGNICIANSLLEGMIRKLGISRLQRDLSDSTVMRNVGVSMGHSLLACTSTITGLTKVQPNKTVIEQRLNENWNIVTEGAQTIMRVNNIKDPYRIIADMTKGKKIDRNVWLTLIDGLPVEKALKRQLSELSPQMYVGYAEQLTEMALKEIEHAAK